MTVRLLALLLLLHASVAGCNAAADPEADASTGDDLAVGDTVVAPDTVPGTDAAIDDVAADDTRPSDDVTRPPDDVRDRDDVQAPGDVAPPHDGGPFDVPGSDAAAPGDVGEDAVSPPDTSEDDVSTSDIGAPDAPLSDTRPGDTAADDVVVADAVDAPPAPDARDAQALCEATRGRWDGMSCGHYTCGNPPDCRAIIPGCDCGPEANFVEGVGCVADRACAAEPGPAELCTTSGGTWDRRSCGHYRCGDPPACDAIIPGCDCGDGSNFVEGVGCQRDRACAVDRTDEVLCDDTGGRWDLGSCGHYTCGVPPACLAMIPGCDCGLGATFVPGTGCVASRECSAAALCASTGGRWDDGGCGFTCGEPTPIMCLLPMPDCQCAPGQSFDPIRGCFDDDSCRSDAQVLCEETAGRWEPWECGHWACGVRPAPDCDGLQGGCNCGTGRRFGEARGCAPSRGCTGCPDPLDPDVRYVSESNFDPTVCMRVRFVCEVGWELFSSADCGCGCVRVR